MTEQSDVRWLPDLASVVLGGSVVYANDETFAAAHNLIALRQRIPPCPPT